ncbi:MAG: nuclear transport factor 2 family protein [Ktedonobacteraceae bacterium]
MNKHIIEALRRGYEAFSRGDIQGAVDAVDPDPDILWIEPEDFYAGGTYRGRQGVAEYLTLSYESSEKVQSLPEEILEVGDKIVVFVHFQAWPKGGGQPREGRIADVYTVQGGKIVQMQAYSDPEEARRAVGIPPRN